VAEPSTDFTVANGSTGTVEWDKNMIPIKYTGNTTTPKWSKADSTNAGNDWFDYDNKKWANAVTVTSTSLAGYQGAAVGTVINESDVLGYFTYIPRYQYQVQRFSPSDPPSCGPAATNNPGGVTGTCSTTLSDGLYGPRNFNIKFQKFTDPIATPAETGDWATHPAFTLGSDQLNGLWVGKFETTGTATDPTIKPNLTSLRAQTTYVQFTTSKRIGKIAADGASTTAANTHNFSGNVDTFQFNNQDWGAVIYLATSAYGAGDATYANGTNLNDYGVVAKNANSAYTTGCGPAADHNDNLNYAGSTTCTSISVNKSYYTPLGLQASTTQNAYGVYDMSGGALERTLSNYSNGTDIGRPSGAGFTAGTGGQYFSGINNKYFTLYNSTTFTNNNLLTNFDQCAWDTCGGQGLYETIFVDSVSDYYYSWSRGYSLFVNSSSPWALRGGDQSHTHYVGLFNSDYYTGGSLNSVGFRVGAGIF
jgi:hypothetical protein